MPIKVVEGLPTSNDLRNEGVDIIEEGRADRQDIRPLRIAILNLMPQKEATELQLLRLIGSTPLQIEVDLVHTSTYQSQNISASHLKKYYKTFDQIKDSYYDGLIITGAPVEDLEFKEVSYHEELTRLLEWSETHVFSRLFICWGAQFALHHYYAIEKVPLARKLFGVYRYDVIGNHHPYLRGFNDDYLAPVSRHTKVDWEQIAQEKELVVLTVNQQYGPDIITSRNQRDLFIFSHLEYDRYTLELEYLRDIKKGMLADVPQDYYPQNDPKYKPIMSWRSSAYLLCSNWLNEIYQASPFVLEELGK